MVEHSIATVFRIARGQLSYTISEWGRIKTEPGYLYNLIQFQAHTAGELLYNINTGDCETPESLLCNPRYVVECVHYTTHNTLLRIANWSVILEYSEDIRKLDEKFGKHNGYYGVHLHFFPNFTLIVLWLSVQYTTNFTNYPGILRVLRQATFREVFIRTLRAETGLGASKPLSSYIEDLASVLQNPSPDVKEFAGEGVMFAWDELAELWEIDKMFITSIEDLKSPTVLESIWKEFDRVAVIKAGKPLIHIIAFTPVAPTWTHKPVEVVKPKPAPSEAAISRIPTSQEPKKEVIVLEEQKKKKGEETEKEVKPSKEEEVSTGPSKIVQKPNPKLSESAEYIVPYIREATPEPIIPHVPKIKTRGSANPPVPEVESQLPLVEETIPQNPIYRIGKDAYEVMRKLFITHESMPWKSFLKVGLSHYGD
ncbi:hypothetical protein C8Q75DRAFT_731580 [Abortiporus biennis]|nr:hypothetical protein C8Q75DRAFT_731580 [Abortiporus biennis]